MAAYEKIRGSPNKQDIPQNLKFASNYCFLLSSCPLPIFCSIRQLLHINHTKKYAYVQSIKSTGKSQLIDMYGKQSSTDPHQSFNYDEFLDNLVDSQPEFNYFPSSVEQRSTQDTTKKIKKQKEDRSGKKQTKSYPTKNFLPCLMKPHRQFIKKKVRDVEKDGELGQILMKQKVSREAYIILYTHPLLRDHWPEMFASKYLYQQLMLSRTSEEQRKVFQSRIRHLENAFWHKKFIGKLND